MLNRDAKLEGFYFTIIFDYTLQRNWLFFPISVMIFAFHVLLFERRNIWSPPLNLLVIYLLYMYTCFCVLEICIVCIIITGESWMRVILSHLRISAWINLQKTIRKILSNTSFLMLKDWNAHVLACTCTLAQSKASKMNDFDFSYSFRNKSYFIPYLCPRATEQHVMQLILY